VGQLPPHSLGCETWSAIRKDRRYLSKLLAKRLASDYLRKARKKVKSTQRSLATAIGLCPGYIAQCENSKNPSKVPLDLLVHVSLITDVPLKVGEQTTSIERLHVRIATLEKELEG